jgi:predicted ABC-type ATPase
MAFYPPEEIEKLRENVRRGIGKTKAPKSSGKWTTDFSLHDKLGIPQPDIMTAEELTQMLQKMSSTPSRDKQRERDIWLPYIDAEIDRVNSQVKDMDEKPELVFSILGGASASGKSTWRKRADERVSRTSFTEYENFILDSLLGTGVIVDPDDAKLMIPEYQAHLDAQIPGGASFVHEESRNIAEALRVRALAAQLPITYDTSGQFNNGSGTLAEMKRNGYKNKAIYFLADTETLVARAKKREEESGRGVPSSIVRTIANNLIGIIPNLWDGGYLDELMIIDTTDMGSPKVLINLVGPLTTAGPMDIGLLKTYFGERNQWWLNYPRKVQ